MAATVFALVGAIVSILFVDAANAASVLERPGADSMPGDGTAHPCVHNRSRYSAVPYDKSDNNSLLFHKSILGGGFCINQDKVV